MEVSVAERIKNLSAYAFAAIEERVQSLKKQGINIIDFGVGDPKEPTPGLIRNYTKRAIDKRKDAGYPSYDGSEEFRETVAKWTKERFNVSVNPATQICSAIGAKEAVFHFPEGFINPGDVVLCPNPGYPPYERGALFAEGKPYFYNLLRENDFLPDLKSIPKDIIKNAKLMWINYPNNPTGATISKEKLKEIVDFGNGNNIIIGSDECYSEIYFGEKPHSILELTRDGVFAVQSLSKRSYMTGYRVGWIAGDERIISIFKKIKTNVDSGTPWFIQDGACAALLDSSHVEEARNLYRKKRDIICSALRNIGLEGCTPEATLYIWQKAPKGMSGEAFAQKLLDKNVGIVATPGAALAKEQQGINPGKDYIRFALVPSIRECREAAERIRNVRL